MTQKNTMCVRIISTSDTHGKVLPIHYEHNRKAYRRGLALTASLIRQAQAECETTLLVDNGDTWQGSAFVQTTQGKDAITDVFNTLRYDVVGLGNHDFDDGLPALQRQIDRLNCPVLCSNLEQDTEHVETKNFVVKTLPNDTGPPVRVGIFSLSPPQIMQRARQHLHGKIAMADMVETAAKLCAQLRDNVDILICLAHTGFSEFGPADRENVAHELVILPLDVLVLGHTHQVYSNEIDGTATVMPGVNGSHIGIVDLELEYLVGQWKIGCKTAQTQAIFKKDSHNVLEHIVRETNEIVDIAQPRHHELLAKLNRPIATTDFPIHSYFATVGSSPSTSLLASAIHTHTPWDDLEEQDRALPRLVSSAAYKCGGIMGWLNYTEVKAGPVTQFGINAICPYSDTITILRMTGAEVTECLERGISGYNQISVGQRDAPLLDDGWASYDFASIFGLEYQVDLSQRARYNKIGVCVEPSSRRVRNLSYQGRPISYDDKFAVAMNSYRAFGGGSFPGVISDNAVLETNLMISGAITSFLKSGKAWTEMRTPFSFCRMPDTTVTFNSSPKGRHYLPSDRFDYLGNPQGGWGKYRLML